MFKDDRYFLIRFTGGSGGDSFSNILHANLNGQQADLLRSRDDHNRSEFNDLFSLEFTHPISNKVTQDVLGLPGKAWYELTQDHIKSVVDYWKSELPEERIGKMHYLMPRELDYRYVFEGFKVVDIRASTKSSWIIRAFHLFKSAMRRKTDDYTRYSRLFGPNEDIKFEEHVKKYGWWPEWYAWRGGISVEEFIEQELSDHHRYALGIPPILDCWVDSLSFTLDETMPWIKPVKQKIGLDLDNDMTRSYLLPWIKKNNEILDFMGLREHLNKDYDRIKQKEILQSIFLEKYPAMLEYNG